MYEDNVAQAFRSLHHGMHRHFQTVEDESRQAENCSEIVIFTPSILSQEIYTQGLGICSLYKYFQGTEIYSSTKSTLSHLTLELPTIKA